jgi:alpha-1,2-glucosyltransferase
MRVSPVLLITIYTVFFLLLSLTLLTVFFTPLAPYAYMDEIFHLPQTRSYCAGRWTEWDGKITTFPGLYLTAVVWAKAAAVVGGTAGDGMQVAQPPQQGNIRLETTNECSTLLLRSLNVVYGTLCIPLIFLLLKKLHPTVYFQRPVTLLLATVQLSLFPLIFFFHFLYYTDTASLFWLLLTYLAHLHSSPFLSANLGLLSVLMRQTNIVWIGALMLWELARQWRENDADTFGERREVGEGEKGDKLAARELYNPTSWSRFPRTLFQFILSCLKALPNLLIHHFGMLLLCLAFVLFVLLNGNSIVVGDKTNHVMSLHLPQMMYFMLFAVGMTVPNWLGVIAIKSALSSIWRNKLLSLSLISFFLLSAHFFTLAHPFLLADNRHYTFYLWKDFFARWTWWKYAMAPVYLVAAAIMQRSWSSTESKSLLFQAIYWFVVGLCLVPTPLLEFRYFTTPIVMWFLHSAPTLCSDVNRSVLAILFYSALNAATLYVFLAKPFTWPDGSEARFMW